MFETFYTCNLKKLYKTLTVLDVSKNFKGQNLS